MAKQIFLKMGEVYISDKPTIVTTVLGSCVTVTMFNKKLQMGGICHGLLPYCESKDKCSRSFFECFKFVDCSIWQMIRKFESYKIDKKYIDVKIFGGANTLNVQGDNNLSIGEKNINAAINAIRKARLNLISFNVGGTKGRKIIFYTHTGEVWVKIL